MTGQQSFPGFGPGFWLGGRALGFQLPGHRDVIGRQICMVPFMHGDIGAFDMLDEIPAVKKGAVESVAG